MSMKEVLANDINAFIVRTPNVRDATEEIVVINPFNTIPEHKRLGQNHSEHYRALIKDAESKKFDMILTREVSRFARNTVDSLTTVRDLKDKGVEVYFVLANGEEYEILSTLEK